MRRSLLLIAISLVGGVIACAAGDVAEAVDDDAGGEDPGDASFPDVRHEASGSQFDVGPPPDAGSGFDATPGDGGGGDSGNPAACASPNNCQTAASIQQISGDTNADTRSEQGYTSKWFQVLVTEDDHSVIG